MENKAHAQLERPGEVSMPHSSSPGEETQPQGLQAACQLELAAVTAVEPSVAKAADVPGGGEDDWSPPVLFPVEWKPSEGIPLST